MQGGSGPPTTLVLLGLQLCLLSSNALDCHSARSDVLLCMSRLLCNDIDPPIRSYRSIHHTLEEQIVVRRNWRIHITEPKGGRFDCERFRGRFTCVTNSNQLCVPKSYIFGMASNHQYARACKAHTRKSTEHGRTHGRVPHTQTRRERRWNEHGMNINKWHGRYVNANSRKLPKHK
jgi:hypothetical protein